MLEIFATCILRNNSTETGGAIKIIIPGIPSIIILYNSEQIAFYRWECLPCEHCKANLVEEHTPIKANSLCLVANCKEIFGTTKNGGGMYSLGSIITEGINNCDEKL